MTLETLPALLAEPDQFFAPTPRDAMDGLLGHYESLRARVEDVAAIMTDERRVAVRYFQTGNAREDRHMPSPDELFRREGAVASLNADFWRRALDLTDIYDCMPQARRDEWDTQIREMLTPDFTEENIRATLGDLLAAHPKFLAERVDGIFRGLSGEHVTNSPSAFGKRMILAYVFSDYGSPTTTKAGLISDLRAVIAKFMGREAPRWGISHNMLRECMQRSGDWHELDGGALRIRVYKKGTAHLEVHPDMAWRLNAILHTLYPHAIPPAQRMRPPKATKIFRMIGRPLPFAVLNVIQSGRFDGDALTWHYFSEDQKPFVDEAMRALESVGGLRDGMRVNFDYNARDVIRELGLSGCLPDVKAHQFYPTPEEIALAAVEMARIRDTDTVLEPSAGTGHIADLLPKARTRCVEIAPLHCKVLAGKGHNVTQADFLRYTGSPVDRVVMNPPYSEGRWLAHLKHAATLLANDGRLVAVLPASARGKRLLDGYSHEWGPVYENEFAGASIDVTLLALMRESEGSA